MPYTPASASCPAPSAVPNRVRHLLFGTLATVQATIRHLHQLGYAEVNDWSEPIAIGRSNEVMAILTKRVRLESQGGGDRKAAAVKNRTLPGAAVQLDSKLVPTKMQPRKWL